MSSLPEEPWRMREMLDSRVIVGETMYQLDPYTHMPIALPAALCAPRPLPPLPVDAQASQASAPASWATYPYPATIGRYVPTGQQILASKTANITHTPPAAAQAERVLGDRTKGPASSGAHALLGSLGPALPDTLPDDKSYSALTQVEMSKVYRRWLQGQMVAQAAQEHAARLMYANASELVLAATMAGAGAGGVDVPVGVGQVGGAMPYGWAWFRPN